MIKHDILMELSSNEPGGEYIRYEPIFDEIKLERRGLIEKLASDGYGKDLIRKHELITDQIGELLEAKTKDLILLLWLIESLTVTQNFSGLDLASKLSKRFIEKFWAKAHPQGSNEVLKSDVITWFDKDFSKTLGFIKLLRLNQQSMKFYSKNSLDDLLKDYQYWSEKEGKSLKRDERQKRDLALQKHSDYAAFLATLDVENLRIDLAGLQNAIKNFKEINAFFELLESKPDCGFDQIITVLVSMERMARSTLEQLEKPVIEDAISDDESEMASSTDSFDDDFDTNSSMKYPNLEGKASVESYIRNLQDRDDIYKVIEIAISRLSQIDPNTPNIQLGKKMLKIKDMQFVDILEELVDDAKARDHVIKFFGIDI